MADQKRLRDELDWEKPYMREKPRNWDLITGLPVPRRIKIEAVRLSFFVERSGRMDGRTDGLTY